MLEPEGLWIQFSIVVEACTRDETTYKDSKKENLFVFFLCKEVLRNISQSFECLKYLDYLYIFFKQTSFSFLCKYLSNHLNVLRVKTPTIS